MANNSFKASKFYNLTNDYLFKDVFSNKDNLKLLLSEFFNIDCCNIIYKNTEILKSNKNSKYGIVDILLEIDNQIYILELQNMNRHNFAHRLLFYVSAIIHNYGLSKTSDYRNLKSVKALAIINYNENYDDYMKFSLQSKGQIFTDRTEYNIVNLKNKIKEKDGNNLLQFFKCNSIEDIEKFKNDKKYFKIYEMVKNYNMDEGRRKKMEDIAQMLMNEEEDYNAAFVDGEEIGKKAGLIEGEIIGKKAGLIEGQINGKKERSFEIARRMLEKNLDYEYISEITDIPIKQIKTLQKSA